MGGVEPTESTVEPGLLCPSLPATTPGGLRWLLMMSRPLPNFLLLSHVAGQAEPSGVNCLFSLGPQLCLFSHLHQRPIAHTLGATQDSSLCLVDWHNMAHETWHRCQIRGRRIWGTEKGRGQASACFPAGGGHCLLPGLPFLHKARPQQAPLCQSLCWSPEFHTTSTYACRGGEPNLQAARCYPWGPSSRKWEHCRNVHDTASPV